jgi:hypothetical protein
VEINHKECDMNLVEGTMYDIVMYINSIQVSFWLLQDHVITNILNDN